MKNNQQDLDLLIWLKHILPEEEFNRISNTFNSKPYRITNAYRELLDGYLTQSASDILTITEEIPNKDYSGFVSALNVPFCSFCEHHFLPFFGNIDLVYEPGSIILGIGKLSRLIDYRAKRFNIQENIAKQLCQDLIDKGKAKGAYVRVKAQHMCACYRGPRKYDAQNTVVYHLGTCSEIETINKIQTILM